MNRIAKASELRAAGILGMNARNIDLISGHNERRFFPRVDDKLKTKILAQEAGVSVPELLGVIRSQGEIKGIHERLDQYDGFVIKPTQGSAGKGVLVIVEHTEGRYVKPSGDVVDRKDMERHISNTLSGLYSLGGKPDVAMIEALVQFSDAFRDYSFEGVPDIRVVVFMGVPVMAMVRLSTRSSDGKANLHQGAVGVGLNMATGRALRAVQHGKPITIHPDTENPFADLSVPQWEELLQLAAGCTDMTKLGYIGVDIVLDSVRGPLILEINARPGLAIQVASGAGLLPRLDWVRRNVPSGTSVEQRVEAAMREFGNTDTSPSSPEAPERT
ncbi:MAG: alpha-L-glutamate ligase-like protein [Myxococcota bacterium]|nr:alpha-L-glutamate ligase-like protein [Myxococcota bacterium]